MPRPKIVHYAKPLPDRFWAIKTHGKLVVHEGQIKVTSGARLVLKVLAFKGREDMRRFWQGVFKQDLGQRAMGAVQRPATEWTMSDGRQQLEVDPRYFAVMGLTLSDLCEDVVAHEAGHAAFAYAARHNRDFWLDNCQIDEENVCYPLGRIKSRLDLLIAEWKLRG